MFLQEQIKDIIIIIGNLGNAYRSEMSFSKVLEHHKEHLAIAKEAGDRAEERALVVRLCHSSRY